MSFAIYSVIVSTIAQQRHSHKKAAMPHIKLVPWEIFQDFAGAKRFKFLPDVLYTWGIYYSHI